MINSQKNEERKFVKQYYMMAIAIAFYSLIMTVTFLIEKKIIEFKQDFTKMVSFSNLIHKINMRYENQSTARTVRGTHRYLVSMCLISEGHGWEMCLL